MKNPRTASPVGSSKAAVTFGWIAFMLTMCIWKLKKQNKTPLTLKEDCTSLQQLVSSSAELATDHTVPPSGICVCPPCAPSRWRPGLPSGSAAGWCGTHPEDLRRSLTCHSQPAARLAVTINMKPPTQMHRKGQWHCKCASMTVSVVCSPECPSFWSIQWPVWIASKPSRCKDPRESFLVIWWSRLMGEWCFSSKGWQEGNMSPHA